MTWVAVGVGVGTAVAGAAASKKSADAQSKAAKNALAYQSQASNKLNPWAASGQSAQDKLNVLLGIGYNDSYESLAAKNLEKFTTYTKQKKKGWKDQIKAIGKAGFVGGATGNPLRQNKEVEDAWKAMQKRGYNATVDEQGLDAFVKAEMEKQRNIREGGEYGSLMRDFTAADLERDSGYQFRLGEGEQGVNRSLSARGGLFSGQAGKELARYNQGFASNEFGSAADRYNRNRMNIFNMLAGQSSAGQNAAGGQANIFQNMAANQVQQGDIKAAGYMGQANALASGVGSGMNYWMSNKALNNGVSPYGNPAPNTGANSGMNLNLNSMYRGL